MTKHDAAEPIVNGRLAVDAPHELYWEICGRDDGLPILFVHGGPGGGIVPRHRSFFDPKIWRAILFDQRGAGQSTPPGEIRHNNTAALIGDMERLRETLGIERWVLFGGSWGSTLSLAYAQAHPDRCLGLILRGIFFGDAQGIDWFMHGLARFSPVAWREFAAAIERPEGTSLLTAYVRAMNSPNTKTARAAARAWSLYEAQSSTLQENADLVAEMTDDHQAWCMSRIEAHFFANDCFLGADQLLSNMHRIDHLPATIVHGRYDLLAPIANAYALVDAWPGAELVVVPNAGHSAFEPAIAHELTAATARMAARLQG